LKIPFEGRFDLVTLLCCRTRDIVNNWDYKGKCRGQSVAKCCVLKITAAVMNENRSKEFAELLDSKFKIPNTNIRFGIDPLLGLIPGAGDWLAGVISLYFLILAAIRGGKASVLGRMLMNILIDIVIGSVPLIGEIFDVGWKANLKNAELLQDLEQDSEKTERQSKIVVWSVCIFSIALVFALLFAIGRIIMLLIEAIL
jgi:hypothetical protein